MNDNKSSRATNVMDIRVAYWVTRILSGIAAIVLFALMAMTCVDVFGRYLFNAPLDGATELTTLMMAVIVFSGLPIVSASESHICVDMLDRFMKPVAMIRDVLINTLGAVAMAMVSWRVWIIAERTKEYGDQTPYLLLPIYPITYFIAIMSAVTGILLAANAIIHLVNKTNHSDSKHHSLGVE